MRIAKQLIGILATGYILVFYSENLFWARALPTDTWLDRVVNWLVYSVLAFVFLSLLARFRVRTLWALFLAGAFLGWLVEGLVVQTAYDALPLSLSFTALAWHALITVWVGFYAVPRVWPAGIRSILLWATTIGLIYGFWGITWWVEPDGGLTPPLDFALFSFVSTLLLMVAYWLYSYTVPCVFKPNRFAEIVVAILLLAYFIIETVPKAPLAAIILPVLLLGLWLTLRHNKQAESKGSLLDRPTGVEKTWHYFALLTLPLLATIVYTGAFFLGLRWHTNWIVYLITTPAGFILLLVSLIKVWQTKPLLAATNGFNQSKSQREAETF